MATELVKPPPAYLRDLDTIETVNDEIEATHYGMKIREEKLQKRIEEDRQMRELMRVHKAELWASEGLEVLASLGAGALSNVKIGQFPLGGLLNGVFGVAGKALSIYDPKSAPMRVVARAGKTLLHTQMGITTREILRGMP